MVGSWTTIFALILAAAIQFYPNYELPWRRPHITLDQGRVVGRTIRAPGELGHLYDQEHFLGIPFAVPPLGALRFRKPLPVPKHPLGYVDAGKHGKACMQPVEGENMKGDVMHNSKVSEDCLTVNVVRPKGNLTDIPVMVWIYGGGWWTGASELYIGSGIVAQSVAIDKPVIYVSLNYRLNLFGFLTSTDVHERSKAQDDVHLNVGYHDQRLALQWVQENIASFGGDPSKVTVLGESAGAISIGAHLLPEYHTPRKLFRAAIMQSGASASAWSVEPSYYQPAYEKLLESFSCSPSQLDASFHGDSIACLRSLSSGDLLRGMMVALNDTYIDPIAGQVPFYPCLDGDFLRESGIAAVRGGRVAKVPAIIGTTLDEGTIWGSLHIDSDEKFKKRIGDQWAIRQTPALSKSLDTLLKLYPDVPSLGSPFPNPSSPNDTTDYDSRLFEPLDKNQYKRTTAVAGDLVFESARVLQLEAYGGSAVPAWAYHFRQPNPSLPVSIGVGHGSEIRYVFANNAHADMPEGKLAATIARSWVRFATDLDPRGPEIPEWPTYDVSSRNLIQLRAGNVTVVEDDFRQEALQWHISDPDWVHAVGR